MFDQISWAAIQHIEIGFWDFDPADALDNFHAFDFSH
jgi:hypothetical protein